MKKILSVLMVAVLLMLLTPVSLAAGEGTFTLMVYLCGTDLESDGGLATADLNEMIASGVQPNGDLRVYVQTGGTKTWSFEGLTNGEAERWSLNSEGLTRLESLGSVDMGDEDVFADFLQYGIEQFPADRYGLILWDHGAGASEGVCYDELTDDSLNMAEIYEAFNDVSALSDYRKFAMVGFDACLMADYEMAVHLQLFADYMIASEETEPGEGWNYGSWLPTLAKNPAADTLEVCRQIVDGFMTSVNEAGYGEFGTLSVLDLSKIDALRAAVEQMGTSLSTAVDSGSFNDVSRARKRLPSFGETDDAASDMIDLGVFAEAFATFDAEGAAALTAALADVVVISRHTDNLSGISGLAVLVPYETRSLADEYLSVYDTRNLMPAYTGFVKGFVATMQSGSHTFASTATTQESVADAAADWNEQYAGDTQSDAYTGLWDGWSVSGDGEAEQKNDKDSTEDSSDVFSGLFDGYTASGDAQNPFDDAQDDYAYTVTLTEEDMEYLASADACLMMDLSDPDFECYVDLGYTQEVIINWDSGKLYGLFDGMWPTLEGQMVCMYDQIVNDSYVRSLIPVTLNGTETYLLVVFDEQNPDGVVVGTTEGYNDAGLPVRGYEALQPGDVVIPQYELIYWDESDEQQSEVFEGDAITVGENGGIAFGYGDVETEADYVYGFCLNDVFGGYQYTDFTTLSY